MVIYLLVEGRTELALKQLLSEELALLREHGGSLEIRVMCGKGRRVGRLVAEAVARGVEYVFALVDQYPGDNTPEAAKQRLVSAVAEEHRDRFRAHVAVHDVEAWMLASWDALCRVAGCRGLKCKYPSPERVDLTKPPKYHVRDLFSRHRKTPGYRETIDGARIFELADAEEIARKCPHFRAFRDELLQCAGVELQ